MRNMRNERTTEMYNGHQVSSSFPRCKTVVPYHFGFNFQNWISKEAEHSSICLIVNEVEIFYIFVHNCNSFLKSLMPIY